MSLPKSNFSKRYYLRRMKKRYYYFVDEWHKAIDRGEITVADDLERRMNLWWNAIKRIEESKI